MDFEGLVELIQYTHDALQKRAVAAVDRSLVVRNWLVGMHIVEFEQHGKDRAQYGASTLKQLSAVLKKTIPRGFSVDSLEQMRRFYQTYRHVVLETVKSETLSRISKPAISETVSAKLQTIDKASLAIRQTVSDELTRNLPLSWSHYAFLIQVGDPNERRFYEIEAAEQGWSTRELKRQFNTSLYERLALSRDKAGLRELAAKGQIVQRPSDSIKEPYVLEFLDLDEREKYSENDLETAIIDRIEHFLLELGKGFLFQSRQYRLTFDDRHFWVDLVFYNRLLRSFVLVDLKIGDISHQDLGQMQMYVNYFDRQVKADDENLTIGILLCKTKNDAVVELTLPEGNETIFASRYQLYLPSKEELREQVREIDREIS